MKLGTAQRTAERCVLMLKDFGDIVKYLGYEQPFIDEHRSKRKCRAVRASAAAQDSMVCMLQSVEGILGDNSLLGNPEACSL